MTLLQCTNLSVGYGNKTVASGINFCVNKGDYLCIIGENGSGKSTLLKTILGLIKPLSGTVKFTQNETVKTGYLPQQNDIQKNFPASVQEIVWSGLQGQKKFCPFYTKRQKETALQWMDKLEIADLARRSFMTLSGGQKQRVLLARALCAAGSFIVLDEPVTALDPKASLEMYGLIYKLNHDDGITVIMISHDIAGSLKYASHILRMGKTPVFEVNHDAVCR